MELYLIHLESWLYSNLQETDCCYTDISLNRLCFLGSSSGSNLEPFRISKLSFNHHTTGPWFISVIVNNLKYLNIRMISSGLKVGLRLIPECYITPIP